VGRGPSAKWRHFPRRGGKHKKFLRTRFRGDRNGEPSGAKVPVIS